MPDMKTAEKRADGASEASINWEDTGHDVLKFTSNDMQVAANGVARLPLDSVDRLARDPGCTGEIGYERAALPNNRFHGNLLFKRGLPHLTIRMIASALALASKKAT